MAKESLFSQSARILPGKYGHGDIATFTEIKNTAEEAISPWNDTVTPKYSMLDVYVANAVRGYLLEKASPITVCQVSEVEGSQTFSSEYKMPDGRICLATLSVTGNMKAAVVEKTGSYRLPPAQGSAKTEFDLTGIMALLLMSAATQYEEVKEALAKTKELYVSSGEIPKDKIYQICDFIEMGVKQKKILANMTGGNFDLLLKKDVTAGLCKGAILQGKKPKALFGDAGEVSLNYRKTQPFKKLYEMSELKEWREKHTSLWTEEEKKLIPKIPDDFPVSGTVQKMLNRYLRTRENKRPMVDMLWAGVSGLGKSTGVEIIAALLGIPLLKVTCFSTMETADFLTSFVPDNAAPVIEIPTDEDLEFDPEMAFFIMTGTWKDGVTTELATNIREQMQKGSPNSNTAPRFKMIESNFLRALEKGYLCEVQEMSRIRDQGVPVGLNEYDRPGAIIPKVDGSVATRHPEALVIYTDNIGYKTCHDLDPAVVRRMAFKIITRKVTKEEAIERIKYNTGFNEKDILEKMYKIWATIEEYCKKNGIDQGICTVNELEQWVSLCQIEGFEPDEMQETLLEAVINKATDIEDEAEEILNVVKVLW